MRRPSIRKEPNVKNLYNLSKIYTLTPAYGKDYNNKASAKEGLRSGQDFVWQHPLGTTYCSVRDFREGDGLNVRYKQQRNTASFTLREDGKI